MGAPKPETSLEWFEQLCRKHGLAVTVQRRTILGILLECDDHPTADQVYELVRERIPGLSRTTVYRVLDAFVRIGAVVRVSHPGSAARYDPKTHRHHHFVCLRCARIIDLEDQRLDQIVLPDLAGLGLAVEDFNIHLRGVCGACGDAADTAAPPAGAARRKQRKIPKPKPRQPRRKSQ